MEIVILTIFLLSSFFSIIEGIWFATKGSKSYGISVRQALLSEANKSFIAPSTLKDLIDNKIQFRPVRYFLKVFLINLLIWPYYWYSILVKLALVIIINTIYEVALAIKDVSVYIYDSYKNS